LLGKKGAIGGGVEISSFVFCFVNLTTECDGNFPSQKPSFERVPKMCVHAFLMLLIFSAFFHKSFQIDDKKKTFLFEKSDKNENNKETFFDLIHQVLKTNQCSLSIEDP
jgi:hypothetical protein